MARVLGDIVNYGLQQIGEPIISAFDTDNALHQMLITEASDTVQEILARFSYRWGLKRTTLTTTAEITDGQATFTNGSATVSSKDASGNDAENFTNAADGMYVRRTGDQTSYKVTAVDTAASPDTVTLETAYVGTTGTGAYTLFKDEYGLTTSDLGELKYVVFGAGGAPTEIEVVDLRTLIDRAGGDLHAAQGSKPTHMAQIGVDSSNRQRWKLWPYPDAAYVLELWYTPTFTKVTDFSTSLFGGDAPELASIAVQDRVAAAAYRFDEDLQNQAVYEQKYQNKVGLLIRGPATNRENQMKVHTGRRSYGRGLIRVESQIRFDTLTGYGE